MFDGTFDGTFDKRFDGMFDGTFDGMFGGIFDEKCWAARYPDTLEVDGSVEGAVDAGARGGGKEGVEIPAPPPILAIADRSISAIADGVSIVRV